MEYDKNDSTSIKSITSYIELAKLMQDTVINNTYKEIIVLYQKSPLKIQYGEVTKNLSIGSISADRKSRFDSLNLLSYTPITFTFDKDNIPVKQLEMILGQDPTSFIEQVVKNQSGGKIRFETRCFNTEYCSAGGTCYPGHTICYYTGDVLDRCYGPFIGTCGPWPN